MDNLTQEEIEFMRNDPETIAGIKAGMHDNHLGRMFSHKEVFYSLEEKLLPRMYYGIIVSLKKYWWRVKLPYQRFVSHRTCPHCVEHRLTIK